MLFRSGCTVHGEDAVGAAEACFRGLFPGVLFFAPAAAAAEPAEPAEPAELVEPPAPQDISTGIVEGGGAPAAAEAAASAQAAGAAAAAAPQSGEGGAAATPADPFDIAEALALLRAEPLLGSDF